MLIPINKVETDESVDLEMSLAQIRCANDLLRNASTRGLNYSEKGFRQKLIDLLYDLGYYKHNKTVFFNES